MAGGWAMSADWVGALRVPPHSGHVATPSSLFLKLPISKMYLTHAVVGKNKRRDVYKVSGR